MRIEEQIQEIYTALKVKDQVSALQKIALFTEWNKQDVKVIDELRKKLKGRLAQDITL